jgi:hypothetical protein
MVSKLEAIRNSGPAPSRKILKLRGIVDVLESDKNSDLVFKLGWSSTVNQTILALSFGLIIRQLQRVAKRDLGPPDSRFVSIEVKAPGTAYQIAKS